MPRQAIPILSLTGNSAGVIAVHRAVTHADAQAGAAANTKGIAREAVAAAGKDFCVDVLGTAIAEAGAAVAKGVALETDANGKLVTKAAGPTVARSLEAAAADGSLFEVLLIPN